MTFCKYFYIIQESRTIKALNMANDGPQLEDPGAIAARLYGNKGAGGEGGENKNNPIDNVEGYLRKMVGFLPKGLLETGLFKQFTPPAEGFLGKPINQGAANLTAKGGAAADFLHKSLKLDTLKDFSKLTLPDNIARLEVKDAPVDTNSNFAPSTMFSSSGGRGGSFDVT